MTIKQLIKLENKAREIWVVSPGLHYDTENKDFSEIVSVNLGEKTKYRYIVPVSRQIEKNLKVYQKRYKLTDEEISRHFLILPESEFTPFIMECAIYDASGDCLAFTAPASDDTNEVIRLSQDTARSMARHFKALWRKYKRTNP